MKTLALILLTAALAAPVLAQTASPSPLAQAKTVQVTETILSVAAPAGPLQPVNVTTVEIERPGRVHLEQRPPGASGPDLVLVSDGKIITQYNAGRKQFRKQDAPAPERFPGLMPGLNTVPPSVQPSAAVLDGKPMLLFVSRQTQASGIFIIKLWTDAVTNLPYRQSLYLTKGGETTEAERTVFTDWKLDAPIDPSAFVFTPPAGATEFADPKLLTSGTPAPDFTVQDRNGKDVKLSDYRGKVVVLDFWATWCGPCQESLPHTNAVARQFRKDALVLAVNVWDTKPAFLHWLPGRAQFDALKFVVDTSPQGQDVATRLYNVTGIPTQYVIGKDGTIVQSFVGYGGPTDDLAHAITKAGAGT